MADRRVKVTLTANVTEFTRSVNRAAEQTDDLRRSAERFAARSYKAKIDVDIPASAIARIGALNNRLDRVSGTRTARIRVNDGGISRRMALIANSIAAIGPAAVAAGATAGAALAALGLTIGTLAAGVGAGLLAFQGVGKALQAMNDVDERAAEDAAANSAQRIQSYRSISDASKQVSRAQRDGAEAVAAAESRVVDAQRNLVASQARVKDSLADLHTARAQAIRDLEDLADRANDDDLDEEDAQIRLIEARQDLNALENDALSGSLDLRKARNELAKAEDNLKDIQRGQVRTTADLNEAQKAGIEGSTGVVQANKNVASANEEVKQAQEDLKDAQAGVSKAQTQAAESVADAQLGLQRAIEDSSAAMGEQSTSAEKLARELAKLGPAGAAFVEFLHDAKPLIQQLQNSAQGNMFPGLMDGIDAAKRALPEFDIMIRGVSRGLGDMGKEAGDNFSSPFWKGYFEFLAHEATPTFVGFFSILENLARGFAGMQRAFAPFTKDVISGLDRMTERFANWGTVLGSKDGFTEFLNYINRVGPMVKETVGALLDALMAVGTAMARVAPVILMGLEAVAHLIRTLAELPVVGPLLFGLAAGLGAVNLAIRLLAITGASRAFAFLATLPAMLTAASLSAGVFAERMALAAGANAAFAASAGVGVASAGAKIATGLVAIGRALPLIGAAAIAGMIALDAFGSKAEENAGKVVKGSMSMQEAMKAETDHLESTTIFWLSASDKAADYAAAQQRVTDEINKALAAMGPLERAQAEVYIAQSRLNDALNDFNVPAGEAAAAADNLEAKTYELGIQQTMAALGIDRQTAALYNLIDAQDKARDSSNSLERADIALRKQYETTILTQKNSKASTDDKRLSELDLEDAIRRAAQALADNTIKQAEASGASDIGTIKANAQRDMYSNLAATVKSPLREQILKLAEDTRNLPDKTTTVTVAGKLGGFESLDKALADSKTVFDNITQGFADVISSRRGAGGRFAEGGPVAGPGTGTSDSINAKLSNGEYVVRAASASRIGVGALNHINQTGSLPGFATGGPVGNLPFFGNIRNTEASSVASTRLSPGPGVAGAAVRIAQAVKGMAAMSAEGMGGSTAGETGMGLQGGSGLMAGLEWARTQAGKPYVWGGGGNPGWDCSGFIGGLVNVIRGRAPGRIGTTFSMPWNGFARGTDGAFVVGNTNDGVGHMAATILGTNVETRGGAGTVIGGSARGAMSGLFNEHYVFQFDKGGIANGQGYMAKGTIAPERVLSPQQTRDFGRLVDVLSGQPRAVSTGGVGGGVTKHFHLTVQNAGGSAISLEAAFKRMEMMAGV